jgi:small subunit ribosomal protein S20
MPIKQSAKKYLRASSKRQAQNVKIKKAFREAIKKVNELVKAGSLEEAKKFFATVQKTIDKAAKSGVVKKNTAARKKSRLAKMINKTSKK